MLLMNQVEAMTMGDRIVVMHDGYLQQVDTPRNLYNVPHNRFLWRVLLAAPV